MKLISTLYMGLALMALLSIPAANGSPPRPLSRMKEGDDCPIGDDKFPEGYCKLPDNCATLPAFIDAKLFFLDDIPSCGFLNAWHSEMLCCPLRMPGERTLETSNFTHLASLAYLKPVTLDDIVYRCTAIILSSTKVLASSNCVGSKPIDNPDSVLVGAINLNVDYNPDLQFGIKHITQLNNDLALFELNSRIDKDEWLMSNVDAAKQCSEHDLKGNPKLYAVAYSQDIDGNNCELFSTQLVMHDDCSEVDNQRGVENLGAPGLHICVKPIWNNSRHSDCKQCLTGSSSVLHVERADGSFCVAGIATPTTQECIVNGKPLYYTSIVSDAAKIFIGDNTPTTATFK